MVGVVTPEIVDMQRHGGVVHKALKKFPHELRVKLPDHRCRKVRGKHKARAPREINHHTRKRFIQGHVGKAVTDNALFVREPF